MSAYVRAYIEACEAYGWQGGAGFKTRILMLKNGRERRNADRDQPQHQFTVPFSNLQQSEYAPIKRMHLNRRGAWGGFLYRDRLDDTATNELVGIALAGQDTFQLSKVSEIDGVEYFRYVYALYSPDPDLPGWFTDSAVSVTVDGTPETAFTLDRDTGLLVFDTPLSGGEEVRWTGAFSLWVRFENDYLPFSIDNKSNGEFVTNGSVSLLEIAPPAIGEAPGS